MNRKLTLILAMLLLAQTAAACGSEPGGVI